MATDTQQKEFIEILRQHSGILHKVCRMYGNSEEDRRDLFQEIVAQVWKSFPAFRKESKISTWIYRIALNTAISDFRKQSRRVLTIPIDQQEIQNETNNEDIIKAERLKQLYNAIAQLNDIEKALVMLYIEEKTYEEMEDILGMTQGNMRVKMNRIKDKLRKHISPEQ